MAKKKENVDLENEILDLEDSDLEDDLNPFDGVSDEELESGRTELDSQIAELTKMRTAAMMEQARRIKGSKQASLADCVKGFKKTGVSRLKSERDMAGVVSKAIKSAAKKEAA